VSRQFDTGKEKIDMKVHNDGNARAIVEALRAAGASVHWWVPSARQRGLPDLVVGHGGRTYLLEVKAERRGAKLSEGQEQFHATWRGAPIATVRTIEEAIAVIGGKSSPRADCDPQIPTRIASTSAQDGQA
jgi:Holliday junction resolvase